MAAGNGELLCNGCEISVVQNAKSSRELFCATGDGCTKM